MGCTNSGGSEQGAESSLLDKSVASVDRDELLRLSRKELYRHLRHLGAAPSEGEGLGFAGLVDTVLLWNVMTQITDGSNRQKAAALKAIKVQDISLVVLQRGLIVVGFKESEFRNLKKKEAAQLLYRTLAANANCDELENSDSDHSDHCQLVENVIEDDVADARMREWQQLCSESRMAKTEDEEERDEIISNGSNKEAGEEVCSPTAHQANNSAAADHCKGNSSAVTAHTPQQDTCARDKKFDALDAELGACLGSHIEVSIAELHSVSPCMADSRKQNQRKRRKSRRSEKA